jgi:tetratricopeptide (TPR) repeat protein
VEPCQQAQDLYKAGKYDEAAIIQGECISQKPNDGVAYYNRGRMYEQLKQMDKALADYTTATQLTPDFIQPYYAISQYYLANKDEDNALKWVSQAIVVKPGMASNYNFRGWIYFNFEQYQLAFKDFTKAIEIDPNNARAYNNRGSARYNIQNVEDAVDKDLLMAREDYLTALKLDSTLAHLYRNLGFVSYLLKDDTAALTWLNKAETKDTADAMVYLYKGMTYQQMGSTGQAIEEYNQAIAIYNGLAEAYFEKAKSLYIRKSYSSAKDNMLKAVGLKESLQGEGNYYLAMISAQLFDHDKMMDYLKEAQKQGYFKRHQHLVSFLKEPAFNDFRGYKPFQSFINKLKGA